MFSLKISEYLLITGEIYFLLIPSKIFLLIYFEGVLPDSKKFISVREKERGERNES